MAKRLFIGNLPFKTTESDLTDLFSRAGTCASSSIVTDRDTGRSRGFGFVEMSTDDEAAQAIETLNGAELQGRKITVALANERPGRR